jgi:hypothetical protein
MHTLQFGRPPTMAYPNSIIFTQRFNRTEQQVDLSVGHWKQTLQRQKLHVPELPPRRDSHESNIKRLRAAMKNHTAAWTKWSRKDEGIHHDRHQMYEHMQNIYRIPSVYQEPNEWLKNHLAQPDHCLRGFERSVATVQRISNPGRHCCTTNTQHCILDTVYSSYNNSL